MTSVPKYEPHYTIDDYRHWEGEWELWKGTAVAMTPSVFGGHANSHTRIGAALLAAIDEANCNAVVLTEIDWIVSSDTVLRPDVTVVCGDVPEQHVESPPALVVEVLSPGTRERDEVYKRSMYQKHGVAWYLMIDPIAQVITALRLQNEVYEDVDVGGVLEVDICETCKLAVKLDRVFG